MDNRNLLISRFLERNAKLNLSALRDADSIYHKHICDALEVQQFDIIKPGMQVADVGTGGGWPLLALGSIYPETNFTGIDARRKKMQAVQAIAIESGLHNIQTQWSRIEDIREKYHIVTARAVAYADPLLSWIHPLLYPGGSMILYKLHTPEETSFIIAWCNKHRYIITQQHHYRLYNDTIDRIVRILTKPLS